MSHGWCTYLFGVVRRSLIHKISLRFEICIEVEAEYDQVTTSTQVVADSCVYHCLQKHVTALRWYRLVDDDWYIWRAQQKIAVGTVRSWVSFVIDLFDDHGRISRNTPSWNVNVVMAKRDGTYLLYKGRSQNTGSTRNTVKWLSLKWEDFSLIMPMFGVQSLIAEI